MARFSTVSGGHGKRSGGPSDFYPTRPEIVEALLNVETFKDAVWEPACGEGHIVRVLKSHGHVVFGSDLYPKKKAQLPVDFLDAVKPAMVHSIVTNPPFRLARQFVLQAIRLGISKHAWLLRLQFAEGAKRWQELFSKTPPARVWVFSSRVQINANYVGNSGGEICWAWWVWERGSKRTELKWFAPGLQARDSLV